MSLMQRNSILVLGNGPSLKRSYFNEFDGVPTLGMNAAYRYWRRINWYPDYYACLDDQVVMSHAEEIQRLIILGKCRKFFLHHEFFSKYPELANHPRVVPLPKIWPGDKNAERCRRLGVNHEPSSLFHSTAPQKFTTGAYAVRFAIWLGYKKIGLIGVDCRYVERVQGSAAIEGNVLAMESTPQSNVNYFFDDYQQQGDRYNVPNPETHSGNLHLQSFQTLKADIEKYGIDAEVLVCSQESELASSNVFAYAPLDRFISERSLSSIAVPFVEKDVPRLKQRISAWADERFAPYADPPDRPSVKLQFCFNGARNENIENELKESFNQAKLERYFSEIDFCYSNLTGLEDQYTRTFEGAHGSAGYMSGPNNQFFDIIEKFSEGASHVLLMEADVAPIRNDWLKRIEDIVVHSEPFWICGSHYRGRGDVKSVWRVNGNAIYNVGSPGFRTFFRDAFRTYFAERVKAVPSLAYDIVLHDMFMNLLARRESAQRLTSWSDLAHRVRFSEFIVDLSHADDRKSEAMLTLPQARDRFPSAFLVHGATELIDAEAERSTTFDTLRSALIALDCDAVDDFGHFLAYDMHVAIAAGERGIPSILVGRTDLPTEFVPRAFRHFHAVFEKFSWDRRPSDIKLFEEKLEEACDKICTQEDCDTYVLYMYTAGLEHAEAVSRFLETRPQFRANINLFWVYNINERSQQVRDRWLPVLLKATTKGSRLTLTVPTHKLRVDFESAFGVSLAVAAHPSTTFRDSEALALAASDQDAEPEQPVILFPGGMRPEKGFDLSAEAALLLAEEFGRLCTVRAYRKADTPPAMLETLSKLESARITLNADLMTDSQFKFFMASGDVIVCPYLASAFARRTSGLVVDAMLLGKPVVVLEGTWLAQFVSQNGIGEVCPASAREIVAATEKILKNYRQYVRAISRARYEYLEENSWTRLVEDMLSPHRLQPRILSAADFAATPNAAPPKAVSIKRPAEPNANPQQSIDETAVVALLMSKLQGAKHVMVDVGAHVGESADQFQKLGWTVLCFEPDQSNREKLSVRFAGVDAVSIDARAVAERPVQCAPFFVSPESTGISGLNPFHQTHTQSGEVEVTNLAVVIRERGLERIDFLKIDVEGYDFAVLKGVPWDIVKPDVIECEFEDSKTRALGHGWKDIAQYLRERGYAVYVSEWHPITRYGVRHDWRRVFPFGAAEPAEDAWGNLLAFRSDPGYAAVTNAFNAVLTVEAATPVNTADSAPASPSQAAPPPRSQGRPAEAAPPPPARPFYAAFGDRLRARAPRAFTVLQLARRGVAGLWRRRAWTLPAGLFLAAAMAAGLHPAFASVRGVLWGGAAFAASMLAVAYVALRVYQYVTILSAETASLRAAQQQAAAALAEREAAHRRDLAAAAQRAGLLEAALARNEAALRAETSARQTALNIAAEKAAAQEAALKSATGALASGLKAEAETRAAALKSLGETAAATVKAETGTLKASIGAVETKTAALATNLAAQEAALKAAAAKAAASTAALETSLGGALAAGLKAEAAARAAALEKSLAPARKEIDLLKERSIGFDIASTLRAMSALLTGDSAVAALLNQPEREHGHALMMAVLVDEERAAPGALKGRMLIEIGTTREPDPAQRSTQKLALFTALTGMRFTTVDMDPENTAAAARTLPFLNPVASAVAQKGEDFLAAFPAPLDFVYLDAYDFDHGKHSDARQARYRANLGADINDEACWLMHKHCAEAIIRKMRKGGIVALDDTWTDSAGAYAGKGKLAMPMLLKAGFEIVAATRLTIALRRAGEP